MPPSEATLKRLHTDYAVSVYRFAWSVTKDESIAQEVVQELFLKLARDATSITAAKSERAVIFTITRQGARTSESAAGRRCVGFRTARTRTCRRTGGIALLAARLSARHEWHSVKA